MLILAALTTIFFEPAFIIAGPPASLRRFQISMSACGFAAGALVRGTFSGQQVIVLPRPQHAAGANDCALEWLRKHPEARLKRIGS